MSGGAYRGNGKRKTKTLKTQLKMAREKGKGRELQKRGRRTPGRKDGRGFM